MRSKRFASAVSASGASPGDVWRDGNRLVYSLHRGAKDAIVIAALDGKAPPVELACARGCDSPMWSPDGRRIAFRREEPDGWRIATMNTDGTDARSVAATRPGSSRDRAPGYTLTWLSPTEIIYMTPRNHELRIVDVATGEDRAFLSTPAVGWLFNPVTSPDGELVAFYWNRDGSGSDHGVFVADRSGKDVRRVRAASRRLPVAWSEDGTAIQAIAVNLNGSVNGLVTVESLEVVDLANGAVLEEWRPPRDIQPGWLRPIPGSREFLVVREEVTSDAWLLEDPLAAAR
jgi:Tol biopolymer transport system component